ncbi:MAG: PDZ domain-containing protein, partial [Pseudomonadota bacterium]
GFAIPAELAIKITDQLIENGRVSRGWLGVSIQNFTPEMAETLDVPDAKGAIVSELVDESPAMKAGIQRGDVIIEVNGDKVADATSVTRKVGNLIAGSENQFVVLRDGERTIIDVVVSERPADPFGSPDSQDRSQPEETEDETGPLGVALKSLDNETRTVLGLEDDEEGLLITAIDRDSPFYESGLREGVAILEMNGRSLGSVADFRSALQAARRSGKEQVLIAVRSTNGRTAFATVDITEDE